MMNGNYGRSIHLRLPRLQTVVLLNLPVGQCLWGIFRRSTLDRKKVRSDHAEDCEEQFSDWEFVRCVATFKWQLRLKVLPQISAGR